MSELETGALGPGRIESRELEQEMRSSFLDYAMSVIVSRALPDVRDGLKPVHRRVLYSMWTNGNRPGRPYVKSANIVGFVMGNFHPHGDSAIYDTLVRMAQPFSLRYPLVDGQGNFGSIDDDPPAAMRYCAARASIAGCHDRRRRFVSTEIAPAWTPSSDTDVDLTVLDRLGRPVRASKLFHSGDHPTLRLTTREGYEVSGTHNHPLLCLVDAAGVPMLLVEAARGDRARRSRRRVAHTASCRARVSADARSQRGAPARRLRLRRLVRVRAARRLQQRRFRLLLGRGRRIRRRRRWASLRVAPRDRVREHLLGARRRRTSQLCD